MKLDEYVIMSSERYYYVLRELYPYYWWTRYFESAHVMTYNIALKVFKNYLCFHDGLGQIITIDNARILEIMDV